MSDADLDVSGIVAKLLLHRPRFEHPHKDLYVAVTDAADALAALERENAALREDREMLDWLEAQQPEFEVECPRSSILNEWHLWFDEDPAWHGPTLRAAIRAARGEK